MSLSLVYTPTIMPRFRDTSNLPQPSMGQYVASIQSQVDDLQIEIDTIFPSTGGANIPGDLDMAGNDIKAADEITCTVLNYTTLNPPVSSGGNVTGAISSTDKALVRFAGATGQLIQNSSIILSDDSKLSANSSTVDMSTSGVLNLASASVRANGQPIVRSSAVSAIDGDIPVFDGTSGVLLKESGIQASAIATKLPLAGGVMTGNINMGNNSITNLNTIAGPVKTSSVDAIVTSVSSSVTDGHLPVFDLTTGKIIRSSGVPVSAIAAKLPTAGGTMTGAISMTGNNLLDVGIIAGSTKSSVVNDIVTGPASATAANIATYNGTTGKIIEDSGVPVAAIATKLPLAGGTMTGPINMGNNPITGITTIAGTVKTSSVDAIVTSSVGPVVDGDVPAFDSTTGKIIKSSGRQAADLVTGPASATDNALARFDTTTGKLIQSSSMSLSDDSKLSANSSTIDMSVPGVLNLQSTSVQANGSTIITTALAGNYVTGPASATDSNIATFDLATGKIIKDSGVPVSAIAAKLPLAGGTMTGAISMSNNNIFSVNAIVGGTVGKVSTVDDIVTSTSASATDSNIVVFDGATGKVVKNSSVPVSDIATKLPLAGGTMTGPINMGGQPITNISTIAGTVKTSSVNSLVTSTAPSSVDGDVAVFDSTTGSVIKESGRPIASLVVGPVSATDNAIARFDLTTGKLIQNSTMTLSDDSKLSANSSTIDMSTSGVLNLQSASVRANGSTLITNADVGNYVTGPASSINGNIATYNGTTGKVIDDSGTAISSLATTTQLANYLPLAGGTMSGAINMGNNNISNIANLLGPTNSRAADNILSCSTAQTAGRLASFTAAAKVLQDSGVVAADVITNSASGTSGQVATWSGAKTIATSSVAAAEIVTSVAGGATGNVPSFSALRAIADSGVPAANLVTSSATGTSGRVATYSGGRAIQDSGTLLSSLATTAQLADYLPLAGGTMTGSIAMGNQSITNLGTLAGPTNSRLADNILSCSTVVTTGRLASFSGSAKVLIDSTVTAANVVTNAGTAVAGNLASFTSDKVIMDSGVVAATLVSSAATGTSGRVATYAGGRAIQDGGVLLSSLATSAQLANYLPLAGGTMIGSIVMGGQNITDIGNLAGPTNSRAADNILSCSTAATTGRLASFSASAKVLVDSTVVAANVVTNAGTGTSGNVPAFASDKVISDSGVAAATIVSSVATGAPGRVATYSGGRAIQDGGVLLSSLATTAQLANYLPLAGGTMSGTIAMGGQNITNVGNLAGPTNSRAADDILSCSTAQTAGRLTSFSASAKVLVDSTIVAANVVTNAGTGAVGNLPSFTSDKVVADSGIVSANVVTNAGTGAANNVPVFSSAKVISDSGTALSSLATTTQLANYLPLAGGTMNGAIAMGGNNITNAGAFLGARLDANGAGALVIGNTNATSLTLGRSGITSTIAGIAAMTQSYASWYATTSTSPAFTANVNRTIDLVNTSGALSEFTNNTTTGALTYTGSRTRRFLIAYNITFTAPSVISSPVTHFIAINPATPPVLGTSQTRNQIEIYSQNSNRTVNIFLADVVQLAANDVIRLCASRTNTNSSGAYLFVSATVVGLLN